MRLCTRCAIICTLALLIDAEGLVLTLKESASATEL